MLAPPAALATQTELAGAKPQSVVLLPGRSLIDRRLPSFLQIEPGRFLAAMAVQQACTNPQLKADSLLAFLPDMGFCVQIDSQDRMLLRQRVRELTGRWPMSDLQTRLSTQAFVAIAPAHHSENQVMASCTCPFNHAPTGSVQCVAQTRNADTVISTVTFLANDIDGDALSETFSYQRDANPVQAGLPSSLSSSCTNTPGTLQCTVNGNAPGPAGIVQLNLSVSDGNASLPLNSLLEVLAPADRIFADGFELPGCP